VRLPSIPKATVLLGDRGHDADWFRNALIEMGISPFIPSRFDWKAAIPHDGDLYSQHHGIENMFARLKDWRRIATRSTSPAPGCPRPAARDRLPATGLVGGEPVAIRIEQV
jgi:transposase